jgi:hypothetical protein
MPGTTAIASAGYSSRMRKGLIALDADGVLLDFHLGYADAWRRAFGEAP